MTRWWKQYCACIALAGFACIANAQAFPHKTVRVVVPVIAGTSGDTFARLLAPLVSQSVGQPVVVDNLPAASGMPGALQVAKSPPDGHTIMFAATAQMISAVYLNKNIPYDPVKDFTPIGPIINPCILIMVRADGPVKTLREVIDYAKAHPGKLTYGSSGTGAYFHLLGESLKAAAGGASILHVPYKGTTTAMQDAAGGRIDIVFGTPSSSRGLRESGKLIPIATTMAQRYRGLPAVPTVAEVIPSYVAPPSWWGFWGPAALPQAVVERLNAELLKALDTPQAKQWLEENAHEVVARTPRETSETHLSGLASVRITVQRAGIQPE